MSAILGRRKGERAISHKIETNMPSMSKLADCQELSDAEYDELCRRACELKGVLACISTNCLEFQPVKNEKGAVQTQEWKEVGRIIKHLLAAIPYHGETLPASVITALKTKVEMELRKIFQCAARYNPFWKGKNSKGMNNITAKVSKCQQGKVVRVACLD